MLNYRPFPTLTFSLLLIVTSSLGADDGKNINQGLTPYNYNDCTTPNDCTDPYFPICLVYFNQPDIATQANINYGKCVQCLSDCHCGVDEFCGPDLPFPAYTPNPPNAAIQAKSNQTVGVKLLSRCFSYNSDISNKMCNPTTIITNVQNTISDQTFCGFVSEWQPTQTTCKGNCDGYQPINVTRANFPGYCLPVVKYDGGSDQPVFCSNVLALGGILAKMDPVWQGYCQQGTCKICSEGSSRCSSGDSVPGIPQVCYNGHWIPKKMIDGTLQTLSINTVAQSVLSVAVLTSILIILVSVLMFLKR